MALLVACGNKDEDTGTNDVPTDIPTVPDQPTPPPTPEPDPVWDNDCAAGYDGLEILDMGAAQAGFDACLATDPGNPNYLFGRGISALMGIAREPAISGLLTACGESASAGDTLYGPDGFVADFEADRQDHVSTIDVEYIVDGVSTDIDFLDVNDWVETFDRGAGLRVDINDDMREQRSLYLDFNTSDVYDDGTNVAFEDGLVIDVANLWNPPGFWMPCSDPGNDCGSSSFSSPSGTITVASAGTEVGETVELEFDFDLPTGCAGCAEATLHFSGSFSDTILDEEAWIDDLPLLRDIAENRCSESGECQWQTEFLSGLADVCPDLSQTEAYEDLRLLGERFDAIAEDFAAAGSSADLEFHFPEDGLFFLFQSLPMNQADALSMAASLRATAATITVATNYSLMDESETLGSLAGPYDAGEWSWSNDTCQTVPFWGMSVEAVAEQLESHAGNHTAGADFEAARADLIASMEHLRAAGQASPQGAGIFDFSATPGFRDAVVEDIDAVLMSLDGVSTTVPSAPIWTMEFGEFFTNPPDIEDLRTETGQAQVFPTELYQSCETEIVLTEATATWFAEENRGLPVTEDVIDFAQTPVVFDPDSYYTLEDVDGYPRFLHPSAKSILEEWSSY